MMKSYTNNVNQARYPTSFQQQAAGAKRTRTNYPDQFAPTQVVYTLAERQDVKYSRYDVVTVVCRLYADRGLDAPASIDKYGRDERPIFTTVELNEQVEKLL